MLRFIIVLALVCAIAALVLGLTYNVTKPLIAQQQEKEKNEALQRTVPGASEYRERSIDAITYYEAYKDDKLIGYILPAKGDGYVDTIDMLVGIDTEGIISGVEILSQEETPGLGARCVKIKHGQTQPWFLEQFKGKKAQSLSLKTIDAITGSTITTDAIIQGLKKSILSFLEEIKG